MISNHLHNNKNNTPVTKAEVISEIAAKTGIEKADVSATIEKFFEVVKSSMADGDNIYVRGFGSFVNKRRAEKIARDISKNKAINIKIYKIGKVINKKIVFNNDSELLSDLIKINEALFEKKFS